MPALPSSALTNGLSGGSNSSSYAPLGNQGPQSQGQAQGQSASPYVLSQAYPPQFTSLLVQRDKRLDAYLADYIRDSGYRLDKLKRKIAALQSNADSYLAAHDFELTGLKRDALVEEVNHEIALLERGFRAERLEAEEKLAAFLAKDKADRIDAFKSVMQSEGEESIERVRKDYLLRRQAETDEIRAEITRRRDEELARVRREMEAESERTREEMRTILERDARQSIEEERLALENAAVEKIKALRAELMKGAEEELALLREKMARSLSDQLAEEERQAAAKREERLRDIKAEIRAKLDRRAADRTAELELHQSRILHEWEVAQTAEYEKSAQALESQYATKLTELQSKAQADFDAQKTTKLQALEFKLLEEMKSNLAAQMLSLKNEFLASRQGLKENLELELRERHAFELAQYRAALVEERQNELESLTADLKRQSDAELVEVTHELQAQKQASLAAIHAQFEQERERWLMKLQAAYGQWRCQLQCDNDPWCHTISSRSVRQCLRRANHLCRCQRSCTPLRVCVRLCFRAQFSVVFSCAISVFVPRSCSPEIDKQLAEDNLLKQYEAEKALSITDLRVTLANRKQESLDALAQKYEAEKALKLRGLNASLARLAVTPQSDTEVRSVAKAMAGSLSEVDKFNSLAKKIQKLQEENGKLKGGKSE